MAEKSESKQVNPFPSLALKRMIWLAPLNPPRSDEILKSQRKNLREQWPGPTCRRGEFRSSPAEPHNSTPDAGIDCSLNPAQAYRNAWITCRIWEIPLPLSPSFAS